MDGMSESATTTHPRPSKAGAPGAGHGTSVGIAGLGVAVPSKALTNRDLEKLVDTSDEWITTRTGIRERRIAEPGTPTSDLAAEAARGALEAAGIAAADLDLIVLATFSPDCPFPATACAVQAKIGAANAAAFDVQAACSGFIYGLSVASQYLLTGAARTALVVGAEVLSSVVDYADRNTCILFGDGAGAAVLTPSEGGPHEGHEIIATHIASDGSGFELLWIPAGGSRRPTTRQTVDAREHFVRMNGREIFKIAVKKFQESIERAARTAGWALEEVDLVVPHQVNTRIIDACAERLGMPVERMFQNLPKYGNTSAASIPLALHEAEAEGRLGPGSKVVLAAVGGGITWASAALRW
jgi:3-oxoacyl-[acyl-carrier-protein] synthase-3